MRFKGHDTFYLRQGWLTKALSNVNKNNRIFYLDKKEQTDIFGIGSNMTKALRYWSEACGVLEMRKQGSVSLHGMTDFGECLWEHDRYIQEENTLWLLHYYLATGIDKSTAWYWLFNEFEVSEFTEEEFVNALSFYANKEMKVAESSIVGDFKCIMKTYDSKPEEYESNMYSPLSELSIIKAHDTKKNVYQFTNKALSVNTSVLFYCILDQFEKSGKSSSREINIERLNSDKNNIGKVFRLNWTTINEHLDVMQKRDWISVVRTAGLDVIRLKYNETSSDFLNDLYNDNVGM